MKSPKVQLYIRVCLADGSRPYLKPAYTPKGRIRPQFAIVNGVAEHYPEGVYHLRYSSGGKRIWEPVVGDAMLALSKRHTKERHLAALAAGIALAPVHEPRAREVKAAKTSLAALVATYLGEIERHKSTRTWQAYSKTLNDFLKVCTKAEVEEIDRRDILNFVDFLRARGNSGRTLFNRVSYLLIFLAKQGRKDVIQPSDRPRYTKKLVKAYDQAQLKRLFEVCDQEDEVLFRFLVGSGCRDNEVVHACWENLDFAAKTYDIKEKEDLNFRLKDHEERTVPLPDSLIALLREHRRRHSSGRLIFAGPNGRPDNHLLRRLKRMALKAGLNCGRCASKGGQSCHLHPVCKEWELHRFRKTFATMHAKAGVKVHTLAKWLGHADLQTTLTYLASDSATSEETREQVNRTFDCLGGAV